MSMERFESLLDRYGPDIDVWPPADRDFAQTYLATSQEGRAALADAHFLETELNAYTVVEPSAALEAALLDLSPVTRPARPAKRGLFGRFDFRFVTTAGVSLACATFGLVIGMSAPGAVALTDDADAFVTAAAGSYDTAFWENDG